MKRMRGSSVWEDVHTLHAPPEMASQVSRDRWPIHMGIPSPMDDNGSAHERVDWARGILYRNLYSIAKLCPEIS